MSSNLTRHHYNAKALKNVLKPEYRELIEFWMFKLATAHSELNQWLEFGLFVFNILLAVFTQMHDSELMGKPQVLTVRAYLIPLILLLLTCAAFAWCALCTDTILATSLGIQNSKQLSSLTRFKLVAALITIQSHLCTARFAYLLIPAMGIDSDHYSLKETSSGVHIGVLLVCFITSSLFTWLYFYALITPLPRESMMSASLPIYSAVALLYPNLELGLAALIGKSAFSSKAGAQALIMALDLLPLVVCLLLGLKYKLLYSKVSAKMLNRVIVLYILYSLHAHLKIIFAEETLLVSDPNTYSGAPLESMEDPLASSASFHGEGVFDLCLFILIILTFLLLSTIESERHSNSSKESLSVSVYYCLQALKAVNNGDSKLDSLSMELVFRWCELKYHDRTTRDTDTYKDYCSETENVVVMTFERLLARRSEKVRILQLYIWFLTELPRGLERCLVLLPNLKFKSRTSRSRMIIKLLEDKLAGKMIALKKIESKAQDCMMTTRPNDVENQTLYLKDPGVALENFMLNTKLVDHIRLQINRIFNIYNYLSVRSISVHEFHLKNISILQGHQECTKIFELIENSNTNGNSQHLIPLANLYIYTRNDYRTSRELLRQFNMRHRGLRLFGSKYHLRTISESCCVMVSSAQPADLGKLHYVTRAVPGIFDDKPSDLIGRSIFDFLGGHMENEHRRAVERYMARLDRDYLGVRKSRFFKAVDRPIFERCSLLTSMTPWASAGLSFVHLIAAEHDSRYYLVLNEQLSVVGVSSSLEKLHPTTASTLQNSSLKTISSSLYSHLCDNITRGSSILQETDFDGAQVEDNKMLELASPIYPKKGFRSSSNLLLIDDPRTKKTDIEIIFGPKLKAILTIRHCTFEYSKFQDDTSSHGLANKQTVVIFKPENTKWVSEASTWNPSGPRLHQESLREDNHSHSDSVDLNMEFDRKEDKNDNKDSLVEFDITSPEGHRKFLKKKRKAELIKKRNAVKKKYVLKDSKNSKNHQSEGERNLAKMQQDNMMNSSLGSDIHSSCKQITMVNNSPYRLIRMNILAILCIMLVMSVVPFVCYATFTAMSGVVMGRLINLKKLLPGMQRRLGQQAVAFTAIHESFFFKMGVQTPNKYQFINSSLVIDPPSKLREGIDGQTITAEEFLINTAKFDEYSFDLVRLNAIKFKSTYRSGLNQTYTNVIDVTTFTYHLAMHLNQISRELNTTLTLNSKILSDAKALLENGTTLTSSRLTQMVYTDATTKYQETTDQFIKILIGILAVSAFLSLVLAGVLMVVNSNTITETYSCFAKLEDGEILFKKERLEHFDRWLSMWSMFLTNPHQEGHPKWLYDMRLYNDFEIKKSGNGAKPTNDTQSSSSRSRKMHRSRFYFFGMAWSALLTLLLNTLSSSVVYVSIQRITEDRLKTNDIIYAHRLYIRSLFHEIFLQQLIYDAIIIKAGIRTDIKVETLWPKSANYVNLMFQAVTQLNTHYQAYTEEMKVKHFPNLKLLFEPCSFSDEMLDRMAVSRESCNRLGGGTLKSGALAQLKWSIFLAGNMINRIQSTNDRSTLLALLMEPDWLEFEYITNYFHRYCYRLYDDIFQKAITTFSDDYENSFWRIAYVYQSLIIAAIVLFSILFLLKFVESYKQSQESLRLLSELSLINNGFIKVHLKRAGYTVL